MRSGLRWAIAVGCLLAVGTAWAELPVLPGDIAFGLSRSDPLITLEQVRGCAKVGNWTALAYPQSVEFDNHGACRPLHPNYGNLLGLNYGNSTNGGALFNFSTDGSDLGQQIFAFNGSSYSLTKSEVGGLGVSWDNLYVSCMGYRSGMLYVLAYQEGLTGQGSGASITNGWQAQIGLAAPFVTQGTTWMTDDPNDFTCPASCWQGNPVVVAYVVTSTAGVSELYTAPVSGAGIGTPVLRLTINSANGTSGRFTDVEFNPCVSPYMYCMFSSYTSGVRKNTLTIVDPVTWTQVHQITLDTSMDTGREISLGPDGYLYLAQYGGSTSGNLTCIDRLDVSSPLTLANDSSVDCYCTATTASHSGIDVAFGGGTDEGACCVGEVCSITTQGACAGTWLGTGTTCDPNPCLPKGACCIGQVCQFLTEPECLAALGVYQGDGTDCSPNPCLVCIDIPTAKALGTGVEVKICNVVITKATDPVASTSTASFTVQHPDGAGVVGGITVSGPETLIQNILSQYFEGDNINIQGTTGSFYGAFQLENPTLVEGNPGGSTTVTPVDITGTDLVDGSPTAELYESMLVSLDCVKFADRGTFDGYYTYFSTDTYGLVRVRIPHDSLNIVDTAIPTGESDISAVILTQFDYAAPYDSGYQIFVFEPTDIAAHTGAACGTPIGACCTGNVCTMSTAAACTTGGGVYVGDGTGCVDLICNEPVRRGDVAYGLSTAVYQDTCEHVRDGDLIAHWANPSRPYLQSMEFDNLGGYLHYYAGNLLALNYGAANEDGTPPNCADYGTRPEEGGKLYNLATNGSNRGQLLYEFNIGATPAGISCTRVTGLGVSLNNQYLSVWGSDTAELFVLAYTAGAGNGTGAAVTNAWSYTDINWYGGSIGTTWLENDTVLVPVWNNIDGVDLYTVAFSGGTFTPTYIRSVSFAFTGIGQMCDVEYNPDINPNYVYLMAGKYQSGANITELVALDRNTWATVNQVSMGTSSNTGREIALGPDGYLYWTEYNYGGDPAIDRIDASSPLAWTPDSSENYYTGYPYSAYNGLDVACGPEPTGACCQADGTCTVTTETECAFLWLGEGTNCTPNPCPISGACCLPTGACVETDPAACAAGGGAYQGNGTYCEDITCPGSADIVINEVWADDPGTDDNEFVELFGTPNLPLAGLSLIVVDGDTAGDPNSINYRRVTVQVDFDLTHFLNASGYFVIGDGPNVTPDIVLAVNSLQNGSQTYALVFTADIEYTVDDPDELTETSVLLITANAFDTVATWDGTAGDDMYFGAPVVQDGAFAADHMYRCPNGVDTDLAADWQVSFGFELGDPNCPGTPGAANACGEPQGACCDPYGGCTLTEEADCTYPSKFQGVGTVCDPNPCPTWCLGDMNCSGGSPTFEDIKYFSAAIGSESSWWSYYQAQNGGADPACYWLQGDYNVPRNGVEFSDIKPFAASIGQPCIPYAP